MPLARTLLLGLHIAAGFVALFMAPAAMLTAKGGPAHRRWGRLYVHAMRLVCASAILLVAFFQSPPFLGTVAVLSFYLAFTGKRTLDRKRPTDPAAAVDWGSALFAVAAGALLAGWGVLLARAGGAAAGFAPVALSLGAIALIVGVGDLRLLRRPSTEKNAWWFRHLTRMVAAYIATVTAFSAVNFKFLPVTVRWLWPTVVGTIGITAWQTYYRVRFAKGAQAKAADEPDAA